MDPARDIQVVENVKGNPLDPIAVEYAPGRATISKMIVDATRPLDASDKYQVAEVPAEVLKRVEREWDRYLR
jgi:3-polyprenyl-4-hydroxybenzoate decarboxylase